MRTFHRRALLILLFSHIFIYFARNWYRDLLGGDDFIAYYMTAAGSFDPSAWYASRMWYPEWAVRLVFMPFTLLEMETAWTVMYYLNVVAWIAFVRKLPDSVWGECAYIATFYPMSVLLGFANVQPILVYLATFPLGAVAAGVFKPYYFGFAILHAIGIGLAVYRQHSGRVPGFRSSFRTPRLGSKGPCPASGSGNYLGPTNPPPVAADREKCG